MKHSLLLGMLLAVATSSNAQDNHGYGAGDGDFKSLSEEIAKLKKHNDMFNVYLTMQLLDRLHKMPIKIGGQSSLTNSFVLK